MKNLNNKVLIKKRRKCRKVEIFNGWEGDGYVIRVLSIWKKDETAQKLNFYSKYLSTFAQILGIACSLWGFIFKIEIVLKKEEYLFVSNTNKHVDSITFL